MKLSIILLRIAALLEGISYLTLLFIAMPLKYFWEQPKMVKIIGMAHGILFVVFTISLLIVHLQFKWGIGKTIAAFIASLIPFGTFYADKKWFRGELTP